MNNLASALTSIHGERVALSDVSVQANLHDLLAEVTVSQTYRNDEQVNIEAVYTFPLPLDAVLLELQVEIGGRVLKGLLEAGSLERTGNEYHLPNEGAVVPLPIPAGTLAPSTGAASLAAIRGEVEA